MDEIVPAGVVVWLVDVLALLDEVGGVCVDVVALEVVLPVVLLLVLVDVVVDAAEVKPIVVLTAPITLNEPIPFKTEYPAGGATEKG